METETRGLLGRPDVMPSGGCPNCGGAWVYVEGDVHYHQTRDWEIDEEGSIQGKEDADWQDSDTSEGAIAERFLECENCYFHWEL